MSIPTYVKEILAKKFTPAEVAIVAANWWIYSQISFSSSTSRQLIAEAKMVLELATETQ